MRQELGAYDAGLLDRPELVCLNKADSLPTADAEAKRAELARAAGRPVYLTSGVSGQGLADVLRAAQRAIAAARDRVPA